MKNTNGLIDSSELYDLLVDKIDPTCLNFLPFFDDNYRVGWIRPQFAEKLRTFKDTFVFRDNAVHIKSGFLSKRQKSVAINSVIWNLRGQPEFGVWNDEYGDVFNNLGHFCPSAI